MSWLKRIETADLSGKQGTTRTLNQGTTRHAVTGGPQGEGHSETVLVGRGKHA